MKIKNWTKFQHFKDRRPPWVKLYRDILDDLEWHELDPLAAKVLVMLWLIASENNGRIPDNKTLAFRLRLTEVKTKEIIIKLSHWLEQDDMTTISEQYQSDSTERETERETETKTKTKRESATVVACPPDVSQQIWGDWVALRKSKKAPITQTVLNGAIAEAKILGWPLEKFLAEWCSRGSQGLKAEWIVKPNPADKVRLTVASSNEPDPALLKIAEDAKKAAPIPLETLARMAQIRGRA
jgi:hypothetical protein